MSLRPFIHYLPPDEGKKPVMTQQVRFGRADRWRVFGGMVLPDRIELSTSPLPMECSTTELRQHAPDKGSQPKRPPYKAADPCHKAPSGASAQDPGGDVKGGENRPNSPLGGGQLLQPGQ